MRRDKSFADDLVVQPGRVSSRVALLLRATERKPDRWLDLLKTSPIDTLALAGGLLKGDGWWDPGATRHAWQRRWPAARPGEGGGQGYRAGPCHARPGVRTGCPEGGPRSAGGGVPRCLAQRSFWPAHTKNATLGGVLGARRPLQGVRPHTHVRRVYGEGVLRAACSRGVRGIRQRRVPSTRRPDRGTAAASPARCLVDAGTRPIVGRPPVLRRPAGPSRRAVRGCARGRAKGWGHGRPGQGDRDRVAGRGARGGQAACASVPSRSPPSPFRLAFPPFRLAFPPSRPLPPRRGTDRVTAAGRAPFLRPAPVLAARRPRPGRSSAPAPVGHPLSPGAWRGRLHKVKARSSRSPRRVRGAGRGGHTRAGAFPSRTVRRARPPRGGCRAIPPSGCSRAGMSPVLLSTAGAPRV